MPRLRGRPSEQTEAVPKVRDNGSVVPQLRAESPRRRLGDVPRTEEVGTDHSRIVGAKRNMADFSRGDGPEAPAPRPPGRARRRPDHRPSARAARADVQTRGERRLARQQSLGGHADLARRRLDGGGETVDAEEVRMLSQELADQMVGRVHASVAPVEMRRTIRSDVKIATGGASKRSAAPSQREIA